VEVDNKRVDSNLKAEEGIIAMQKCSSKQTTWFKVARARHFLQMFSKFQNFHLFPKHLS
jgi:hypothetical protein